MSTLIVQRRFVAEGRVAPPGVIPAFDVVEQRAAGIGRRAEALTVQQLTFERRKETLAQGIVIGIADRAHRGLNAEVETALAVGDGRVLAAMIGMMDDLVRTPLLQGHVERG